MASLVSLALSLSCLLSLMSDRWASERLWTETPANTKRLMIKFDDDEFFKIPTAAARPSSLFTVMSARMEVSSLSRSYVVKMLAGCHLSHHGFFHHWAILIELARNGHLGVSVTVEYLRVVEAILNNRQWLEIQVDDIDGKLLDVPLITDALIPVGQTEMDLNKLDLALSMVFHADPKQRITKRNRLRVFLYPPAPPPPPAISAATGSSSASSSTSIVSGVNDNDNDTEDEDEEEKENDGVLENTITVKMEPDDSLPPPPEILRAYYVNGQLVLDVQEKGKPMATLPEKEMRDQLCWKLWMKKVLSRAAMVNDSGQLLAPEGTPQTPILVDIEGERKKKKQRAV